MSDVVLVRLPQSLDSRARNLKNPCNVLNKVVVPLLNSKGRHSFQEARIFRVLLLPE